MDSGNLESYPCRYMKETCCSVAENDELALQVAAATSRLKMRHELTSREAKVVGNERLKCPKKYFCNR